HADLDQLVDRCRVAVHREHGVGDDDRSSGAVQQSVDGVDIAVRIHMDVAAAEPAAVDDRRMVELVTADTYIRPCQRRKHTQVGRETRRKDEGALAALPGSQLCFELAVDRTGTDDEAGRATSSTPSVEGGV